MEPPRPAVGGIGTALDKARVGKAVDHPAQRDRLDFEIFGEAGLVDPLAPRQREQHPPLRPADTVSPRPCVEPPPDQAAGIAD